MTTARSRERKREREKEREKDKKGELSGDAIALVEDRSRACSLYVINFYS